MRYRLDVQKLRKPQNKEPQFPYCRHSMREAFVAHNSGYTWESIAESMGLSYATLFRHRQRYLEEQQNDEETD